MSITKEPNVSMNLIIQQNLIDDMRLLKFTIMLLWELYWMGTSAKVINEHFHNITTDIFKMLIIAEDPDISMKTVWKHLKTIITLERLKKLSRTSPKMSDEIVKKTESLLQEILDIYNRN